MEKHVVWIEGGTVRSTAVINGEPAPGWTVVSKDEFDTMPLGSIQNESGVFVQPKKGRRIPKLAFLSLLTPDEYASMFTAKTDPVLLWGSGLFQASPDPFNIDDARTALLLSHCVSAGILSAERKAALEASMLALAS